jgi:hypothetical protein
MRSWCRRFASFVTSEGRAGARTSRAITVFHLKDHLRKAGEKGIESVS